MAEPHFPVQVVSVSIIRPLLCLTILALLTVATPPSRAVEKTVAETVTAPSPANRRGERAPLKVPATPPASLIVIPAAPLTPDIPNAPQSELAPRPPPAPGVPGPVPVAVLGKPMLSLGFAADSILLDEPATTLLTAVAKRLAAEPSTRVELRAYAARSGLEEGPARRLSLARARAVRSQLTQSGISQQRLIVFALGSAVPDGHPDRVDLLFK